jgi:hypothetical protein
MLSFIKFLSKGKEVPKINKDYQEKFIICPRELKYEFFPAPLLGSVEKIPGEMYRWTELTIWVQSLALPFSKTPILAYLIHIEDQDQKTNLEKWLNSKLTIFLEEVINRFGPFAKKSIVILYKTISSLPKTKKIKTNKGIYKEHKLGTSSTATT